MLRRAPTVMIIAYLAVSCQNYPFELRLPKRVEGRKVAQVVATLRPTDILFVIDNSGSMLNARTELGNNVRQFINAMSDSASDFHVGIVTTDVDCNIPERSCAAPATSSSACCALAQRGNIPVCVERDLNADGKTDWSNCDGGRLRAPQNRPAFWSRPSNDERAQWTQDFTRQIMELGCQGSGLESGLEAARRALNCAKFGWDPAHPERCPAESIADLNRGFLRDEADLVLIFLTDEDDCSFFDARAYQRPADAADPVEQARHLCAPTECYAYYGQHLDQNGDGLQDWADPATSSYPLFSCEGNSRAVNPPYPDAVNDYLAAVTAVKDGDVRKVRAAGIVAGATNQAAPLHFKADSCSESPLGPTNNCGCWSAHAVNPSVTSPDFYCALTGLLGHASTAVPANTNSSECSAVGSGAVDPTQPQPGCKGMPGGRYMTFLETLAEDRVKASARSDTLANSICQAKYDATLFAVVNNIILTSCFDLGETPRSADAIQVVQNGMSLTNVSPGSDQPGWSWVVGENQVCLEGGLKKKIGDEFSIFIVDAVTSL